MSDPFLSTDEFRGLDEENETHPSERKRQKSMNQTTKPTNDPIEPIDLNDFLNLELPKRELILSPWLPEQGLAMVYATRGVGKTLFSLSVGLAVATGGRLLRFDAPCPRRVLFVDGEMPASAMQERLRNLLDGNGQPRPAPGYFRLITPDLVPGAIPDISRRLGQEELKRHLGDVELLILDNLSCLCRSGVENESESWIPVQEFLLDLRQQGITVLLVHHAGKSGKQRGTSKREDVLDTVISLRHPADYKPGDGARFILNFEKNRHFMGDEASGFEVSVSNDLTDEIRWTISSNVDLERAAGDLKAAGKSSSEIAADLGVSKSTAHRLTVAARARGLCE